MNLYHRFIARGSLWILFSTLFLAVAAFLLLPRFAVEAGTDVLLDDRDPDLEYYNQTRSDWGTDEYVIVCVTKDDWFTPPNIATLISYEKVLAGLPHVRKTLSIAGVPLLRNGSLEPITLAEPKVDLARARKELIEHTQAKGNLISSNGRDLSVLVYLDPPADVVRFDPVYGKLRREAGRDPKAAEQLKRWEVGVAELNVRRQRLVAEVRRLAAEWRPKFDEPVRLSGLPVININLVEHVSDDLKVFGVASFAFFTLMFVAIYRKIRWTGLPIVACVLPVVLILGLMVATGNKVTVITSNLPVLLFILTLPYTVYFIERYRERRALFPAEDAAGTCAGAGRDIWTPCLYSSTTTMAGFASLLTSGIVPVRTFGAMMTLGMGVGLGAVFLFLPAATRRLRTLGVARSAEATGPIPPLRPLLRAVLKAPWLVVGGSAAILIVAAWGTTRLKVETKFIDYFWPSSEIYVGLDYIDQRMGGTTPLEIMLRSETKGHFRTLEGLKALAAAGAFFDGVPETGNMRSVRTLLDEVRKRSGSDDGEILEFLEENFPELVSEFTNKNATVSRVLVRMRETAPTLNRNDILRRLRAHLESHPDLKGLTEKRPTGVFLLYANMLNSLIQSQKDTFLIVVASIWLMLVILFRSPILATVVLIPQVLPVFVVLGTMGFAGIALDLVTVMIASVAMGVGIDAAIQYTVRFRKELARFGDREAAIRASHATIGRAILIATSVNFAGFLVLFLSKFVPTVYFGLFTGLAMLMGLFGSLTTLPAMFVLFRYPRK
jgi:hypothetical protein